MILLGRKAALAFLIATFWCNSVPAQTEPDPMGLGTATATLINDHPRCNGPGFAAFAVQINAQDLEFAVTGNDWDGFVRQFNRYDALTQTDRCVIADDADSPDVTAAMRCNSGRDRRAVFRAENPPACNITSTVGQETVKVPTACPAPIGSDPTGSLNAIVRQADIQIDISARAEICQSVTGIGILDSAWTVTVDSGGGSETFSGAFGSAGAEDPTNIKPLMLSLGYLRAEGPLRAVPDDGADQFDPMQSGHLRLSLQFDPFTLPDAGGSLLQLDAARSFRIAVDKNDQ